MVLNPLNYKISDLNKFKPKKGRLLVAEPFMEDPYFKRSVVLLTEYDQKGAFGFMLNKPLDVKVKDMIANFPDFDSPVYMGGPVQSDNLFYIHTQGKNIEGSQHIIDNLYWAGNFEQLKEMIIEEHIFPNEILFFIGYSGWDYKQLENEIEDDSWIINKLPKNIITKAQEPKLWQNTLKSMGNQYAVLSNFPENPSLN